MKVSYFYFIKAVLDNRKVLWNLSKNDFKAKFIASFLGGAWAFVQPMVSLLVFWFVFQVGFKNPPVNNVPFIIWFAPAYLSWTFYSEALISGTGCLLEYSYLVKKLNFQINLLPLVKIMSTAFVHLAFIIFIFFMLIVCGVPLSIYNIQVIYYFLCTCVLLAGQTYLLSAMAPFAKDVVNIVNVCIQIGFWLTPIFWAVDEMSAWVQNILCLNPMFYICQGYRDAFVNHSWFWERGIVNFVFWFIAVASLGYGAYLFEKLRPQFADVL